MTVPSVSMKSALGMAHPAPVNGGDLALGPDHVTLRHLSILLIALAAASCATSSARWRPPTRPRLHAIVCSHSPRLLPVRSRLPHKSQFTRVSYSASASPLPHICWAV